MKKYNIFDDYRRTKNVFACVLFAAAILLSFLTLTGCVKESHHNKKRFGKIVVGKDNHIYCQDTRSDGQIWYYLYLINNQPVNYTQMTSTVYTGSAVSKTGTIIPSQSTSSQSTVASTPNYTSPNYTPSEPKPISSNSSLNNSSTVAQNNFSQSTSATATSASSLPSVGERSAPADTRVGGFGPGGTIGSGTQVSQLPPGGTWEKTEEVPEISEEITSSMDAVVEMEGDTPSTEVISEEQAQEEITQSETNEASGDSHSEGTESTASTGEAEHTSETTSNDSSSNDSTSSSSSSDSSSSGDSSSSSSDSGSSSSSD